MSEDRLYLQIVPDGHGKFKASYDEVTRTCSYQITCDTNGVSNMGRGCNAHRIVHLLQAFDSDGLIAASIYCYPRHRVCNSLAFYCLGLLYRGEAENI